MFTVDIYYLKSSARLEITIRILQIRKMRLHMVNLLEVTYPLEGRLCWNQIQPSHWNSPAPISLCFLGRAAYYYSEF